MSNYLFIDDSGSKEWKVPYSKDFVDNPPARSSQNMNFWRDNYFVLAGVHITSEKIAEINPMINAKKMYLFGTDKVELHSANLRNPKRLKKDYLDKYNITRDQLNSFINDFWYPLFRSDSIQLMAVIVDKRYYKNYRHGLHTPLDIAATALFDRTEFHPNRDCNIVFDQMDQHIHSSKNDQGKIIRISNTKINLEDGKYERKYHHTTVSFDNSANSNFLQMADMVAYNVWRQFVDYGDEWDNHSPAGEHRELPMYPYFKLIADNFYHSKDNQVSGWGIVKLPDPYNKEKPWKIQPDN